MIQGRHVIFILFIVNRLAQVFDVQYNMNNIGALQYCNKTLHRLEVILSKETKNNNLQPVP